MPRLEPRAYPGELVSVYDGDTCTLDLDLGFRTWRRTNVRLYGINCIELKDPGGRAARMHLMELVPFHRLVTVTTIEADKYGDRWLGIIIVDGTSMNEQMVIDGYAARWDGTGVRPVPTWPIGEPT